jgi:hypothetical protein
MIGAIITNITTDCGLRISFQAGRKVMTWNASPGFYDSIPGVGSLPPNPDLDSWIAR